MSIQSKVAPVGRAATAQEAHDDAVPGNSRKFPISAEGRERAAPAEAVELAQLAELTERAAAGPASALSERQRSAIELLVTGKSLLEVYEAVDVDPKTLYNWRKDDDFRRELERRRGEVWDDARRRLRGLVHASLDVLEQRLRASMDYGERARVATTLLRFANLPKAAATDESRDEFDE
jgi:hypothetical protein